VVDDTCIETKICQFPTGTSFVVSLDKDASLAKPEGSGWEGNPFIKNIIMKFNVLDLNGANNATSNLCELAAQRYPSLTPIYQLKLIYHTTTNSLVEVEKEGDPLPYDPLTRLWVYYNDDTSFRTTGASLLKLS
jgi:hypothetical protein